MANDERGGLTTAERKRLLIAQGTAYRLGVRHSRIALQENMASKSLARRAIGHVAAGAFAAVKSGAVLKTGSLRIFLPLLIGGISRLSRKSSVLKPLARGILVIGTVMAVARLVMQRKKAGRMKKHNPA